MKLPFHLVPGLLLCAFISLVAIGLQMIEEQWFGHPYVDGLVLAILLGALIRTFWAPGSALEAGIDFSAKTILEIAVMLFGASASMQVLFAGGPLLFFGIVVVVVVSIGISFGLCRMLGMPKRVSVLIACGNSICGNSAIAAVAPVIGAKSHDIATAIAFTAVLGVGIVVGLPAFIPLLQLSDHQYGILAGLTVYAVPQVLAATVPIGAVSAQIGTMVKLTRVLMLGPVIFAISLWTRRKSSRTGAVSAKFVPWFIVGFIVLATLRSFDLIPVPVISALQPVTVFLTVVSMAALGLGADLKALWRVGKRAALAVTMSLVMLIGISLVLLQFLPIA